MTSSENVFFSFHCDFFWSLKLILAVSPETAPHSDCLCFIMFLSIPLTLGKLLSLYLYFMRIKIVPIHSVVRELNNMKCINSARHKGNINVRDYYYNE